jgi:small nuclear ribonucleoprotein E
MNVVLDDAEEVYDCSAKPGKEVKPRRELGEWTTSDWEKA